MNGLGVGPGGTLYASNGQTLYTINPTTGALSAVGTTSIGIFDMGSTTSGLFAVGTDMNLYSINPNTAAATLIGPTGLTYFNGHAVLDQWFNSLHGQHSDRGGNISWFLKLGYLRR